MSTKEMIFSQLSILSENDLNELYLMIKQFVEVKRRTEPSSLMSKLKQVRIDAPPDFAAFANYSALLFQFKSTDCTDI